MESESEGCVLDHQEQDVVSVKGLLPFNAISDLYRNCFYAIIGLTPAGKDD